MLGLADQHPEEQGLKLAMEALRTNISKLADQHPEEQGLKLIKKTSSKE